MFVSMIRILIVAGFIAAYDVFIKGIYVAHLDKIGETYGFGQALIMYMAVITAGWLTAYMATRRLSE